MSRVQSPSPTPSLFSPSHLAFEMKWQRLILLHDLAYDVEMNPIRCRGLLFDLDGVLVDSTPAVSRVWAGWARERGFEPDEVVRQAHGRPSIGPTIRELLPYADHAGGKPRSGAARDCRCRGRNSLARRDGLAAGAAPGALGDRDLLHALIGGCAHRRGRTAAAQTC